jgi:hypothetical protein
MLPPSSSRGGKAAVAIQKQPCKQMLLWIALMFIVKGCERAASAPLPRARGVVRWRIVHGGRQSLSDDGDQALMRGLATAFPFIRPGLALSSVGRRFKTGL